MFPSSVYEVRTFLSAQRSTLKQAMLDIFVAGNSRKIPIFIDDDINIKINFNGLHNSIEKLKKKGY